MYASMEVGRLSEKAAHLKTIPELTDYKTGDELADRLGTITSRILELTTAEKKNFCD